MAVNVSVTTSVCLCCKTTSSTDTEREFHEIYDEVGLEMQLPTLVEKFFHIKIESDVQKLLCDDCLNRLIELYDLEELAKEKVGTEHHLEGGQSTNNKPVTISKNRIDNNLKKHVEINEISSVNRNSTLKLPKNHLATATILKNVGVTRHNDIVYETDNFNDLKFRKIEFDIKNIPSTLESATFIKNSTQGGKVDDISLQGNCNLHNLGKTHDDYNESPPIKLVHTGLEDNEDIQLEENNSENNLDIENLNYSNTINCEEYEINENKIETMIVEEDQQAVRNEVEQNFSCSDENDFIEEYVILEDNEISSQKDKEKIEEELENLYYEEESVNVFDNEAPNETVMSNLENNNIELISLQDEIILESDSISLTSQEIVNENNEDSIDEIEEEYLIEEISCSNEFDEIDINVYLEKVLITKFQDLDVDCEVECSLCLDKYSKFKELLNHACITEFELEQQFKCIVKNCKENINSLQNLARHLILQHYEKLESISIYGQCPDCQKTFSNIIDFNKHSCCRSIKKKAGSPNYCQYCDLGFQSLKRFIFHMQFHLTNHRPKVCLLCGDLFNNSNDFFEHTQYKHNADSAMACIKCDRFFKNKDVFDSHMDLHEDSKYQFTCEYCPKKYTNKMGLSLHMDVYHSKSKAFQCVHCKKEFMNNHSFRNHMKSHATGIEIESFICSACGLISDSYDFIKEHTETDKDSPCFSCAIKKKILKVGYTCENCSVDFYTIKHLKQHRLSNNHSDDLFHCGVCRRAFKTLRHMRNHSMNHKDFESWQEAFPITRYFVCNIGDCEESYKIWTTLYYHKKRPHKTKGQLVASNDFKCQFCQQICTSKMSLAVHVARSHNNTNIHCPHCKRAQKSQKLLQQHIDKFHTPVKCDLCYKQFKNRRNLDSHKTMKHLKIKRYFCKFCEKGYFHKSEMEAHEQKVHPEFSYKCELCSFITNYPKSLEIHMDKHNNKQKFNCTYCTKTFGRKQLLEVHIRRHENKKEYVCSNYLADNGCDASFFTFNLLKNHIQSKHAKDKLKEEDKPTKTLQNFFVEIEDEPFEIIDDDDISQALLAKHPKIGKNSELAQNVVELVLENELQSVEEKSEHKYII